MISGNQGREEWDKAKIRKFQGCLVRWYARNRRKLPWRDNPTPYRVWISEIMLQQTQVNTVIPYFNRFLKRFPDLESLAKAREHDVLAYWSGLGYYNRARNLHKAANLILQKHGDFPKEYKDILSLPGVGKYTAGAISSIAFNKARPVVDGNVQRVLTRLKGITKSPSRSHFWDQMSAWIPESTASSFNQAMMELGALVCVPNLPRCPQCPIENFCVARRLGIQDRIPGTRAKKTSRQIQIAALVLEYKGKILLTSTHKPYLIPGKWGLPCQLISNGESAEETASELSKKIFGRIFPLRPASTVHHSISRYRIKAYGFFAELDRPETRIRGKNEFLWMPSRRCNELLTSSLFRKVLERFPESKTAR
jgi:A/G-specific adenine glycosylase